MAYERYDRDDGWRGERDRRDDEGARQRGGGERGERGFFERAGNEISSWFGDERGRGFGEDRENRDRDDRMRGRGRERREERSSQPMDWTMSNRDYRDDFERGNERRGERDRDRDYRPVTGDYGRGSEWQRDSYRRTSFAGSAARSNHQDPPYGEWRRRHMDELDRDYEDYRREHQARFESDFGEWRQRREGKRGLMGQIREHMEVVGSDGEHVGTVDRTAGDRLILAKSDPDSGGHHHSISCTTIDRVEDDKVMLDMRAEKARERWRDDERERALFEREDQGEAGPGMLNRSFSGTYR